MSRLTIGEVTESLLDVMPRTWAEPWDRVGLQVGDASWEVDRILVGLDLDERVLSIAEQTGAQLILTHHPPFLDDVVDYTVAKGSKGTAWRALRSGIGVASFHTNLDRSPDGAEALSLRLGLEPIEPLEAGSSERDRVSTYAPADAIEKVVDAMTAAGAGRIGSYEACSFESMGQGRFAAREGSRPCKGEVGTPQDIQESRVEAVCSIEHTGRVVSAVRRVHPYEEPLVVVERCEISRGTARLGRMCSTAPGTTVDDLAAKASAVLGVRARVWGEGSKSLTRVACANGSGTSLISRAQALGAEAMVLGEVRYHAAKVAADEGLVLVECGHDATEWPLVEVLASLTRQVVDDSRVEVDQVDVDHAWWTWGDR